MFFISNESKFLNILNFPSVLIPVCSFVSSQNHLEYMCGKFHALIDRKILMISASVKNCNKKYDVSHAVKMNVCCYARIK